MRPPPREEGRIIIVAEKTTICGTDFDGKIFGLKSLYTRGMLESDAPLIVVVDS